MSLVTIRNAISRHIDNPNVTELARAVDKVPAGILNDICDGTRWEDGEDTIDSEAFRYGLEIAENYDFRKVMEIRQILGG